MIYSYINIIFIVNNQHLHYSIELLYLCLEICLNLKIHAIENYLLTFDEKVKKIEENIE